MYPAYKEVRLMERRSLDEILANVKTGRAISPAGIINAAKT